MSDSAESDQDSSAADKTRIGDAERQAVIMRLSEAHALGQLDVEEFDERTSAADQAKTVSDLAPLTSDLPGGSSYATKSSSAVRAVSPQTTAADSTANRDRHADKHELKRRAQQGDEAAQRKVAMGALGTWIFVSVITTVIWLATNLSGGDNFHNGFWPIWPMIGLGIPLVASVIRWKIKD